ncbi:MAG TPA: tetratricopeptide repeat protein [Mucilaginibacter sp.]|jgi:tetratricopeptide (TPR) repeat protein|nr:tetratricopeptide repeat protein [Mucilaginibacter sp.]
MGLFDFLNSSSKKPSINLDDFRFLSDDHTRIENGRPITADNKGAWRGIRVKTSYNNTFHVTMYNMNGNHPVWGNNIQMAEKQMKLVEESSAEINLRGFGTDVTGASFADYGLTLHKSNGNINKVTLHMYDRNVDIVYQKAGNMVQSENLNQFSDFDDFKKFTHRWNTSMSMQEKMQVAMQSDTINNQGVEYHEAGDLVKAIEYFERALALMPNNDDALKNLKVCYSQLGNRFKVDEMEKKLDYLS